MTSPRSRNSLRYRNRNRRSGSGFRVPEESGLSVTKQSSGVVVVYHGTLVSFEEVKVGGTAGPF